MTKPLVDAVNELCARRGAAPVIEHVPLSQADRAALAVRLRATVETLKAENADPRLIEVAEKAAALARKRAAGGGRASIARKEAALVAALEESAKTPRPR